MHRFRINAQTALLTFLVVIPLLLTFGLNLLLALNQKKILRSLNSYFQGNITTENIFYVFPSHVIFKNLSCRVAENRLAIFAPRVVIRFSIQDFLTRQSLSVGQVGIQQPSADFEAVHIFVRENSTQLASLLREWPHAALRIDLRKIQINFSQPANRPQTEVADMTMLIHGPRFQGYATVLKRQPREMYPKGNKPLRTVVQYKGAVSGQGLELDNLTVKNRYLDLRLWGQSEKQILALNGYAFIQQTGRPAAGTDNGEKQIYILDVDSRVKLGFPQIVLQRLNFSINKNPVELSGNFIAGNPATFTLSGQVAGLNGAQPFTQAEGKVSGAWREDKLLSTGDLNLYFLQTTGKDLPLKQLRVTFTEAGLTVDPQRRLLLDLARGAFVYRVGTDDHALELQNVQAQINFEPNDLTIAELQGPFYGGQLQGRAWLDSSKLPLKITAQLNTSGVKAEQLADLLKYFSQIDGALNSRIVFSNAPDVELKGQVSIKDGRLRNFEFFQWLADTFALESLKNVDFDSLYANFIINNDLIGLSDIELQARDVALRGYFQINSQSLLSSKLSMSFSRPMLERSEKLRRIAGMFEDKVAAVTFDFQLSGTQDAVNFQWLDNGYKEQIRKRMPDFIERIIERRVEESIDPAPIVEPVPQTTF